MAFAEAPPTGATGTTEAYTEPTETTGGATGTIEATEAYTEPTGATEATEAHTEPTQATQATGTGTAGATRVVLLDEPLAGLGGRRNHPSHWTIFAVRRRGVRF